VENCDPTSVRLYIRQLRAIRPCEPQPHVFQWLAVPGVQDLDRENVFRLEKTRWRKSGNE
jgi:hypothetical protein